MKQFFLFVACIALPFWGRSQDAGQRLHHLHLTVAGAFPVGDFRSRSFEQDQPAFGRNGFLLQGSYSRQIHRNFSVGASAGFRENAFHRRKFLLPHDELVKGVAYSPYRSLTALADAYWHSPNPYTNVYFKGSLGVGYNQSASLRIVTDFGNVVRTTDWATALAYGLAAGLRHEPGKFGVVLETGYLFTRPTFRVADARGVSTTYPQWMNSLQLSVGGSFRF